MVNSPSGRYTVKKFSGSCALFSPPTGTTRWPMRTFSCGAKLFWIQNCSSSTSPPFSISASHSPASVNSFSTAVPVPVCSNSISVCIVQPLPKS